MGWETKAVARYFGPRIGHYGARLPCTTLELPC